MLTERSKLNCIIPLCDIMLRLNDWVSVKAKEMSYRKQRTKEFKPRPIRLPEFQDGCKTSLPHTSYTKIIYGFYGGG